MDWMGYLQTGPFLDHLAVITKTYNLHITEVKSTKYHIKQVLWTANKSRDLKTLWLLWGPNIFQLTSIDYPALTLHKTGHADKLWGVHSGECHMSEGSHVNRVFPYGISKTPPQDFPRHPIRINIPMKTVLAYQ